VCVYVCVCVCVCDETLPSRFIKLYRPDSLHPKHVFKHVFTPSKCLYTLNILSCMKLLPELRMSLFVAPLLLLLFFDVVAHALSLLEL